jgi:hypothetical protein
MAKKIILTEEQLKRISSLINEEFDSHIYDLILDKYNEVGLEGMAEDEVAYLKSGGETDIPTSFREPEQKYDLMQVLSNLSDDDEFDNVYDDSDDDDLLDPEEIEALIRTLSEIVDMIGRQNIKAEKFLDSSNMYVLIMPYNEDYFQLLLDAFGNEDREVSEGFTKVIGSRKSGKMGIRIPASWYKKIFGEDAN